jgi:NADPH:quinone reductase-like Zn-dependent oxidoreductase
MVASQPPKLTPIEAASLPLAGQTAWQAIFDHGQLQAGQTALIHGAAGGVGSYAVQLARWKGARVLATASADDAEYVRSLGAEVVIDYRSTRFESVARNVDLVLDLIGGETQERSFDVLKPGGCLISTVQEPSPEEAAKHRVYAAVMRMQPSTKGLQQIAELVEAGSLKLVVTKIYPLAQARDAWVHLMTGHPSGKLVLEVPGE